MRSSNPILRQHRRERRRARSTTRSSTTRCSGRRSARWSTTSRPISPPGDDAGGSGRGGAAGLAARELSASRRACPAALPAKSGASVATTCHDAERGWLPSRHRPGCAPLDRHPRRRCRRAAVPAAGAVPVHALRRAADGRGGLVQLLQLERLRQRRRTSSGWRNFELLFANRAFPHRARRTTC